MCFVMFHMSVSVVPSTCCMLISNVHIKKVENTGMTAVYHMHLNLPCLLLSFGKCDQNLHGIALLQTSHGFN